MGNGQTPPGVDLDSRGTIDNGTLGLNESPPPGPIGLDAKNGSAKGGTASMADRIVAYARRQRGDRVGDGQCYTFADRALRQADARSARDNGDITPDADYVWGTSVTLAELQPGDVIQFRNYTYEREIVDRTLRRDGDSTGCTGSPASYRDRPERGWQRCGDSMGAERAGRIAGQPHAAVLHQRHDDARE